MRKALVFSIAVHALAFGVTRPLAVRPAAAAPPLAEPEDRWSGTTADLPGAGSAGALYDVAVEAQPPAPPAPAALPAAEAPVVPVQAVVPAVTPVVTVAAPTVDAPAVPRPIAAATTLATARSTATPKERPAPEARPSAEPLAAAPSRSKRGSSSGETSPGGGGGTFGAEGPASVRDLGRAFTRAIPPANDTDSAWAAAPLGDSGKLEVVVHVDESGHITGAEPRGISRPAALVSLVRRTVPMLQAGTFAVRDGSVTEGTEILELRATVSDSAAPADEAAPASGRGHLAFEYARGRGKASFTQAGGRRVDISVKVLNVESR